MFRAPAACRRLLSAGAPAALRPQCFRTVQTSVALAGARRWCCHTHPKAIVQRPAPAFTAEALMPDKTFKSISLADYKGKYLVLFFYPLDFTFVCPTEITAFSDRVEEFQKLNCEVVACSVDSKFSHLAWSMQERKKGGLGDMKIPIIADITKKIAADYGALITEGGAQGVALRGLYIIDKAGVLRQITINDLPVGRSVDEVLRLVEAFQYSDNNAGMAVPCNWKPGGKTMKADPQGSQEYFASTA
eukprot:TRINITY_DN829_c0_g2_i1.p1 TRINITY_DN829_c0_g2~~TRINITY_DN829_c0_g2_i1.p1  ORF type:complete len:246 (+),score=104.43 TRINITY_DN829_c0_g2_i1:79-816(+)